MTPEAILLAIASVVAVSLVSLIGVMTLAWDDSRLDRVAIGLVALAVGALYGDAFIHLIPEALERLSAFRASLCLMGGILGFFLLEKLLRRRDLHHRRHHRLVVEMNLVGDALHNTVDGMLIAASYGVSVPLGIATTLAVLLHEIPQELGDFGVLVHGGVPARRAIRLNLLSGIAAIAGAGAGILLGAGSETFTTYLVPVTAGGFLYLAGSNLVPELQHQTGGVRDIVRQLLLIGGGVAAMAALSLLE
jgi:zinc and cadmium transporter